MHRQRGSVFVMAVAVLAGLVAILASLAATHQVAVQAESNRLHADRARLAAESGLQRSLAVLQSIAAGTGAGQSVGQGVVTLNDEWAQFGQVGSERFMVGATSFRIQIIDLAARVNLSSANQFQLERMPMTSEQIDSLLDFREAGFETRPEGAKDNYYNNLTEGYNTKLRTFDSLDELLQVKGFTPRALYEPQTDVVNPATIIQGSTDRQLTIADLSTVYSYSQELNPLGEAKIAINAGDQATRLARLIQAGFPPQVAAQIAGQNWPSMGQLLLQVQLQGELLQLALDNLTSSAAPRRAGSINLNTATEAVLNTLPGITPDIAQAINQRQSQGFASLGEIVTIPGVTSEVLAQCVDLLTVTSDTFLVRILGTSGRSTYALEAVVDIQEGLPVVIHLSRPPYANVIERWDWERETSTETVLKEAA
jgi:type II secretory pathway component PulK